MLPCLPEDCITIVLIQSRTETGITDLMTAPSGRHSPRRTPARTVHTDPCPCIPRYSTQRLHSFGWAIKNGVYGGSLRSALQRLKRAQHTTPPSPTRDLHTLKEFLRLSLLRLLSPTLHQLVGRPLPIRHFYIRLRACYANGEKGFTVDSGGACQLWGGCMTLWLTRGRPSASPQSHMIWLRVSLMSDINLSDVSGGRPQTAHLWRCYTDCYMLKNTTFLILLTDFCCVIG